MTILLFCILPMIYGFPHKDLPVDSAQVTTAENLTTTVATDSSGEVSSEVLVADTGNPPENYFLQKVLIDRRKRQVNYPGPNGYQNGNQYGSQSNSQRRYSFISKYNYDNYVKKQQQQQQQLQQQQLQQQQLLQQNRVQSNFNYYRPQNNFVYNNRQQPQPNFGNYYAQQANYYRPQYSQRRISVVSTEKPKKTTTKRPLRTLMMF